MTSASGYIYQDGEHLVSFFSRQSKDASFIVEDSVRTEVEKVSSLYAICLIQKTFKYEHVSWVRIKMGAKELPMPVCPATKDGL